MTSHEKNVRASLEATYAEETTQEIREKLYYYLGVYRRSNPNWTVRDWIRGLSIVLKMRLAR